MKNVFFTAIALIAFSAASFANTIEIKEETKVDVIPPRTLDDCLKGATYVYEYYMDYCGWGVLGEQPELLNNIQSDCYK